MRTIKQFLAQSERAHGDGRWLDRLPGIVKHYNEQFIAGTNVRRKDVSKENYLEVMNLIHHSRESAILFNIAEGLRYPSHFAKYIWKFFPGDRVLLARRVEAKLKKKIFEKPSVEGSFGPKVYVIESSLTKINWKLFIVPVSSGVS